MKKKPIKKENQKTPTDWDDMVFNSEYATICKIQEMFLFGNYDETLKGLQCLISEYKETERMKVANFVALLSEQIVVYNNNNNCFGENDENFIMEIERLRELINYAKKTLFFDITDNFLRSDYVSEIVKEYCVKKIKSKNGKTLILPTYEELYKLDYKKHYQILNNFEANQNSLLGWHDFTSMTTYIALRNSKKSLLNKNYNKTKKELNNLVNIFRQNTLIDAQRILEELAFEIMKSFNNPNLLNSPDWAVKTNALKDFLKFEENNNLINKELIQNEQGMNLMYKWLRKKIKAAFGEKALLKTPTLKELFETDYTIYVEK